jgi:glycosyltransferase involved in cell wall biosynthesis
VVDLLFFHLFKLCGIKIVYSPHDIYNFKYSLNRRMILRFFNLSHIIIAHNTANIQLLKKDFDIPDTKLRLIRQGNMNDFLHPNLSRDQARRQIGLALDKKIILFFGNIREGKGAETAVRAIAGIPDKRDILFVMAGKPMRGYDLREIETTLTRQDIKTHALMRLQFIEEKDVEAYYKSADIVLVPYEKIYTSAVICYAFSCGCATIVSDVKEFADFVRDGENTIVFTAGDHLDLTAKMVQLLENPQLLKKIAHNAKHFADHEWAWEKTANQLKEIYSAL